MAKKKEVHTNYSLAWLTFLKSKQYKELSAVLTAKRVPPAYAENILNVAFTAGFNSTGTVIKIVSK